MASISIPTASALHSTQLVPAAHPAVNKTLCRLSRSSLLSLALDWLDDRNAETNFPYLASEDADEYYQDLYPPAQSLEALREIYTDLQSSKGGKRDVVDRMIEGDWRDGITLYQLAMADMQYLYDHPTSQKWTALKIARLAEEASSCRKVESMPRFHPSTFLKNLHREALPDVKAHYNLDRHPSLPLTILRVFIVESPYNTSAALHTQTRKQQAAFDPSKVFYIAFPDASPFVYVSLTTSATASAQTSSASDKSLRRLILDGIPKAFSKPRERYKLESTRFSARNLEALIDRRGGGNSNGAGGGWGVYAEGKRAGNDNPLRVRLPTPESLLDELEDEKSNKVVGMKRKRVEDDGVCKRRRAIANARFGSSGKMDDGKGIERFDILLEDPFPTLNVQQDDDEMDELAPEAPEDKKKKGRRNTIALELEMDTDDVADEGWRPDIRLTFHGSHVFAGIRQLVELGVVDGKRMPGWMTGEEAVSVGVVKSGRIKGNKGCGL